MKQILISLFVGVFTQIAVANSADMQLVYNKQGGSFYAGALPKGFTSKELLNGSDGSTIVPEISADLKKTLNQLEEEEKLNWIDYVISSPWEFVECPNIDFDDESSAAECYKQFQGELDLIALNPEKSMGSAIIELEEAHAIYKGEQLVGYVFEFANNVDASIIQDGSGIVIYLDADMNVLYVDDWQS
jgi:hypothetical protein